MIAPKNQEVTLDYLKKVKLREPEGAGRSWVGVKHSEFLNTLFEDLKYRGWKMTGSVFALSKDKANLIASLDLLIPKAPKIPEQKYCLGFVSSNTRRLKSRMFVGTNVMTVPAEETGFVSCSIALGMRTLGYDLVEDIRQALNLYESEIDDIGHTVDNLEESPLSQNQIDKIIMRASRIRPVQLARPSWEVLGTTLKLFNKARDKNAWDMMVAFSLATKGSQVIRQMYQLNRFRQLLTKIVRVKV